MHRLELRRTAAELPRMAARAGEQHVDHLPFGGGVERDLLIPQQRLQFLQPPILLRLRHLAGRGGGGPAAVAASHDPMIELARLVDPTARAVRKRYEDQVEAPIEAASEQIAQARFRVYGTSVPPDATFTPRLSFGKVAGYEEHGRHIPPLTVFMGLFAKATKMGNRPPYQLPQRWIDAKPKLKPLTPMNLVSTNDIIGGNSGSPLINRAGELVGLIFDGNLAALADVFVYRDAQDRAVSVDSVAILQALRLVYGAGALADELTAKPKMN